MKPVVAVVSPWDLEDERAWSGVVRPMVSEMRKHSDLIEFGGLVSQPTIVDRGLAKAFGKLGRDYLPGISILTATRNSKSLRDSLSPVAVDAIVSLAGSTFSLRTPQNVPLLQITDSTFGALVGFYPLFSNLSMLSEWQGKLIERRNVQHSDHFLVSSDWAKEQFVNACGVPFEKVTVSPFGAGPAINFSEIGGHSHLIRPAAGLRILFVSSDWRRKGGAEVLRIFERFRGESPDSTLTIVGDAPILEQLGVTSLGRQSSQVLAKWYANSDVLIEATNANAGGMTLTDAAAFGLPVISRNVGGVGSIVDHGKTGFLIGNEENFIDRAVHFLRILSNSELRTTMGAKAKTHYDKMLSWSAWGNHYSETIKGMIENE